MESNERKRCLNGVNGKEKDGNGKEDQLMEREEKVQERKGEK